MGRKTGESILGVAGGLLGVLAGIIVYFMAALGPDGMSAQSLGAIAAFLGALGFIGGAVVGIYKSIGGALMLIAGVAGFIVVSYFWIAPGIILIIGGIITFKKPKAMQVNVEGDGS